MDFYVADDFELKRDSHRLLPSWRQRLTEEDRVFYDPVRAAQRGRTNAGRGRKAAEARAAMLGAGSGGKRQRGVDAPATTPLLVVANRISGLDELAQEAVASLLNEQTSLNGEGGGLQTAPGGDGLPFKRKADEGRNSLVLARDSVSLTGNSSSNAVDHYMGFSPKSLGAGFQKMVSTVKELRDLQADVHVATQPKAKPDDLWGEPEQLLLQGIKEEGKKEQKDTETPSLAPVPRPAKTVGDETLAALLADAHCGCDTTATAAADDDDASSSTSEMNSTLDSDDETFDVDTVTEELTELKKQIKRTVNSERQVLDDVTAKSLSLSKGDWRHPKSNARQTAETKASMTHLASHVLEQYDDLVNERDRLASKQQAAIAAIAELRNLLADVADAAHAHQRNLAIFANNVQVLEDEHDALVGMSNLCTVARDALRKQNK